MIDISTISYETELITETGARYVLNNAKITEDWEECVNELAQRATIRVANADANGTRLHALAKINCIIRIKGSWNGGGGLLFDGTIWDWHYTDNNEKELTIIAYDPLIRLQQSREFYFYQPGMTTQALVNDICGQWGIPVSYKWPHSITHGKKAFRGKKSVSGMIIALLEEVRDKTGADYIVRWKDGQMEITGYGTNDTVYLLDRTNTISTSDRLSINNLVTKVKVYGRKTDDGRSSVEAIVEGDTRFGVLQEIVMRDSNTSIADAMSEANALIANRGKPDERINWNGPDVPPIRKGDMVEMNAGSLVGFFYVEGVTHRADSRSMNLTLSRVSANGESQQTEQTSLVDNAVDDGDLKVGDAVILNGPVFVDSFGNGRGRTFTNFRSTITITAPLSRYAPFHIGSVGWARPGDITRG
ncbi:MAG: hypothetical protein FWB91_00075 [Defluviitaleaceae bacterium]|nr:hypothetical protein [Defluviitaleaceae bacterium]